MNNKQTKFTLHEIVTATAEHLELPSEDILDPDSRKFEITRARHIAQYICRQLTNMSSTQIAEAFGQLDHSTVLKAVGRVERDREETMADVASVLRLVNKYRKLGPPDRRENEAS